MCLFYITSNITQANVEHYVSDKTSNIIILLLETNYQNAILKNKIQWNLCIMDTLGPKKCLDYQGVLIFQVIL